MFMAASRSLHAGPTGANRADAIRPWARRRRHCTMVSRADPHHRPIDPSPRFRCNRVDEGDHMTTIIGLGGSLRRESFNRILMRAADEAAPAGTSIELESIREIPLYDGDLEDEHAVPDAVQRLKDRIANADGLLIATPEYNH